MNTLAWVATLGCGVHHAMSKHPAPVNTFLRPADKERNTEERRSCVEGPALQTHSEFPWEGALLSSPSLLPIWSHLNG